MKFFKATFYDYWDIKSTRKTEIVRAKTRSEALAIIQRAHPEIGTAIVFTSAKELRIPELPSNLASVLS